MRALSHLSLPLCVDTLVVEHQNEKSKDTSSDEAELQSMPEDIPGRVLCPVEVGSHCWSKSVHVFGDWGFDNCTSCKVADRDLDGLTSGSLGGAGKILEIFSIRELAKPVMETYIRKPRDIAGKRRIQ